MALIDPDLTAPGAVCGPEGDACGRRSERVGSFGKGLMVIKAMAEARHGTA